MLLTAVLLWSLATPALEAIHRIDASTPVEIQVALALAAGPPVAARATVYVLGRDGYVLERQGTNGFTCLVTRERPDTLEPECHDAEGAATTLKARFLVEELRAKGTSEADIHAEVEKRYADGRLQAPRKAGLVYMLSDYNYVFDPDRRTVIHFPGHLMFYAPFATPETVGSGPGAPYLVSPGRPDALMIVVPAASAARKDHVHER